MSRVLFDVGLHARCGEVVTLLGRNGAGKSTTLKAIIGIVRATAGSVVLDGCDVSRLPLHAIAKAGIGYVPQDRRIFVDLTVRENLEVGRSVGPGRSGWDVERVGDLFPALRTLADRRGGSLSGGEQQMLAIARTLMGNPRVLLLDEPSEGLAPKLVQAMAEQVLRLKESGMTVVLSEQNIHFTSKVSDRAYVLEKGHIRFEGSMGEVHSNTEIVGRYLSV
jgi:branched-chain amino acid transport system ATP-binding protein